MGRPGGQTAPPSTPSRADNAPVYCSCRAGCHPPEFDTKQEEGPPGEWVKGENVGAHRRALPHVPGFGPQAAIPKSKILDLKTFVWMLGAFRNGLESPDPDMDDVGSVNRVS